MNFIQNLLLTSTHKRMNKAIYWYDEHRRSSTWLSLCWKYPWRELLCDVSHCGSGIFRLLVASFYCKHIFHPCYSYCGAVLCIYTVVIACVTPLVSMLRTAAISLMIAWNCVYLYWPVILRPRVLKHILRTTKVVPRTHVGRVSACPGGHFFFQGATTICRIVKAQAWVSWFMHWTPPHGVQYPFCNTVKALASKTITLKQLWYKINTLQHNYTFTHARIHATKIRRALATKTRTIRRNSGHRF